MKMYMDEEKVSKSIEKIKMYKKLEDVNFDNIIDEFDTISCFYNTSNKARIVGLQAELINKLNTISKIHNNKITILYKNLEKYKNTKLKVEGMFDNII
ncbi:MAG: hypothetical protein J6B89_02825 [Bacilli bacterium]|nr:hypothetical protein [Bacilli bacterium]